MRYRQGYKYVLEDAHVVTAPIIGWAFTIPSKDGGQPWVQMDAMGTLRLREGYAFDGPSWAPDWDEAMTPAAEHDALYQAMREGRLPLAMKGKIDAWFERRLIAKGMWRLMAKFWHCKVKRFAKGSAIYQPRKVLTAP